MGGKGLKAVVARAGDPEPPADLARLRAEYERRYRADDVGRWHAGGGTVESVDFAGATLLDDLGAEWLAAVDTPYPTDPTDPADLARTGDVAGP